MNIAVICKTQIVHLITRHSYIFLTIRPTVTHLITYAITIILYSLEPNITLYSIFLKDHSFCGRGVYTKFPL